MLYSVFMFERTIRNNNVETLVLDRNTGILTRRIRQVAFLSDEEAAKAIITQFTESVQGAVGELAVSSPKRVRRAD